mgnify:CR=1 FL=1
MAKERFALRAKRSHRKGWRRLRTLARLQFARRIGFGLGCIALIFWGCYCIQDGRVPWTTPDKPVEPPPKVELDRVIRVRLQIAKSALPAKLRITSGYQVLDTASQQVVRKVDSPLGEAVVSASPSGSIKIGGEVLTSRDITFSPSRDGAIVINGSPYRGLMRLHVDGSVIRFTNHVDIESYLRGVLRGELPRHFHAEAFKTQCVAARTYAMYQKLGTPPGRDWDVFDNEGSQMYIGVKGEEAKSDTAVTATAGEVCAWNERGSDRIFCTYYSSTCGGVTQPISQFKPSDPDVPPLAGNVICTDCYLSRYYRWGPVKLTRKEVTDRVVARYPSVKRIGTIVRLRPKDIGTDGRIIRIQMDAANGDNETLVGEDFRLCMGGHVLRSTAFAVEHVADGFVFREGKGFGHGCGLCQYGMETKALRGMNYREILSFYYPSSKVIRLY